MSTRCQVQIIEQSNYINSGDSYEEKVTLYHHSDGYPSNMLQLFWDSWKAMHNYTYKFYKKSGFPEENCKNYQEYMKYQLSRCGYVASFLCYADPIGYNPLDYHDLHGDIEYYYRLYTSPAKNDKGIWEIVVYTSHACKNFRDHPSINNMNLIVPKTPLDVFITKKNKVNKNKLKDLEKTENELYYEFQQNKIISI